MVLAGACSRVTESTKVGKKLQATRVAGISKNGIGVDRRAERYDAEETHLSVELKPASLSSVNRGEVR